jgi:hypothetical protein
MDLKKKFDEGADSVENWYNYKKIRRDEEVYVVPVKFAIEVAKQYALECCERQREIMANKFGEDCPACDNVGYYVVPHYEFGAYEPIPQAQQCEFCYCQPNSKFNMLNAPLATEINEKGERRIKC